MSVVLSARRVYRSSLFVCSGFRFLFLHFEEKETSSIIMQCDDCVRVCSFSFVALEFTRFSSHYTQRMVKQSPQDLSEREAKEQACYGAHIAKSWNVELSLGRWEFF